MASPTEPHLTLWNTETYYSLRTDASDRRLRIDCDDDAGRLIGSAVFGIDSTMAVAGFGAPFGGFDLVRSNETVANIERLVDFAVGSLRNRGITDIEVRAKPDHYGSNAAALMFVMLNRGFTLSSCDINTYIDLSSTESVDDYIGSLKPAARKMLRKSERLGLRSIQLDPADEAGWAEAYDVLRINRVSRGRPMRLPFDYVQTVRDAFPGRVRMLCLRDDTRTVAAALLYRILPEHDVVQYWGDGHHHFTTSPMNLLVRDVVVHALAAGTRFLDVGISSEDGVPNHGLLQFKRSVGCRIEPRIVLQHIGTGQASTLL